MKRPTLNSFFHFLLYLFFLRNILYVWWFSVAWFMYIFPPCQHSQLSSINFHGELRTHTHTNTLQSHFFVFVQRTSAGQFKRSHIYTHTYSNKGTIANMHKSHFSTQTKNPVRNYRIPAFFCHIFAHTFAIPFSTPATFLLPCLSFIRFFFLHSFQFNEILCKCEYA